MLVVCLCLLLQGDLVFSRRLNQVSEEEVVKGQNDERKYRAVTLSNGLRTILVHDNTTETTAVEIRVAAGFLAEETMGLAHFLEHMLFEGSLDYPDPMTYLQYLSSKGGKFNGATWETTTMYHFQVVNEAWIPAARMLAAAIARPLMAKERLASAIQAVDSEYKGNLNNDHRSLYAIAVGLGNPASRYNGFVTGSSGTLNVSDIHQQAVDFHATHYSANIMTLAIVANNSLDSMENLAEEIFGAIPNSNIEIVRDTAYLFPPRDPSFMNRKVYYNLKDEGEMLFLMFPVPVSGLPDTSYIRYLLDYEGRGSIHDYLLTRGLATMVGMFTYIEDNDMVPLMIYCRPTSKGGKDPDAIVATVFKFLKAACSNGINTEIWEQNRAINEMRFRFKDKEGPGSYASELLDQMYKRRTPADYLGAPSRSTLDMELENRILSYLTPDNFNYYFGSSSLFSADQDTAHGPRLNKFEQFYSTSYADEAIPQVQISSWLNVEADPALHLPATNSFIPEDFKMVPVDGGAGEVPVELANGEGISVWWLQETEFPAPKIDLNCILYPPAAKKSAKEKALWRVANEIWRSAETVEFYDAREVDYSPYFWMGGDHWQVTLGGWSDPTKVELVLDKLFEVFSRLDFDQDEAFFNSNIRVPAKQMLDERNEPSLQMALTSIYNLIYTDFVEASETVEALEKLTLKEVEVWKNEFMKDVSMVCSVFGNVNREQALRYAASIKRKFLERAAIFKEEDRRHVRTSKVVVVPTDKTQMLRARHINPTEINSAAVVAFQVGKPGSRGWKDAKPEYTIMALTRLLELAIKLDCFNYLRTEKQLGYVAGCEAYEFENSMAFGIFVQGAREDAGAVVMTEEINNFVEIQHQKFKRQIAAGEGVETLQNLKKTLTDQLKERSQTFADKTHRLKKEVFALDRDFARVAKQVEAVAAVTPDDFQEFFERFFVSGHKRKVVSQIFGAGQHMPNTLLHDEILIKDTRLYKQFLTETY